MIQESEIITRLESIEGLLQEHKSKPLGLEEAATYLNVSKSYLYKLTSTNRIPYYKPSGKLVFFDKRELDQWILHNRVKPQSEIEAESISHVALGRNGRNDQ
jgi:excisionase family DNA binding protein